MRNQRLLATLLALLCLGSNLLLAQSQLGTGALSGTVLDPSQAPIAGATVTVTNAATGLTRTAVTTGEGAFVVPVLPSGTYNVRVEATGFSTLEQNGVAISVGATATPRYEMKIGAVAETVTIEASAVVVDTGKTSEESLVDFRQIQDLPINGRRFDQFALLTPGVARDGRFGLLSYRGQAGIFNNFMVEGNDDNQAFFSEARGRTRIAGNISANAIQEFQVGKGAFLAEFGRAAGGSINAVLRSGSNRLHGDAFWYFRNELLNARDPLASFRPTERRDQFGGSVSGPVIKDKLFFFFNYDRQLRDFPLVTEDLGSVLTTGGPVLPNNATAAQQQQFALDQAAFNAGVNFLRGQFPGGAPGNAVPRNANQDLYLFKADWNINSRNTLSAFFNRLDAKGENAIQTPLVLGNVGRNGTDAVDIWAANARLTTSFTSTLINEFRFQWSRDLETQFGNAPPPQVFVGNTFSFGLANFLERPAYPDERRLQFVNNLSYIVGSHTWKFGGEVNRAFDILNNPANFGATYNYANALVFGRDLLGQTPNGNYSTYTQSFGLPGTEFATIDYAWYVQDQWKIHPQLTLNYGLRWDYQQLPSPQYPNPEIVETTRFNKDRNNFGPRFGLAWDVYGDGKTVLRAGYAMYYGRTPNATLFNALLQTGIVDPARNTVSISLIPTDPGAPRYPNTFSAFPASVRASATNAYRLSSDFERPRVQDINIGIERQLVNGLVLSASVIYSKGDYLPIQIDSNLPAPNFTRTFQLPTGETFNVPFVAGVTRTAAGVTQNVNSSRPDPRFGAITLNTSDGLSWYRALFLELKKRYSAGIQFGLAYTFARAENQVGSGDGGGSAGEGPFSSGRLFDQFDLSRNRGYSPTDQRHRAVFNWVWDLPKTRGGTAFTRGLINGYRLSGIYTAESGRSVATLLNVPQIPFATPDGTQWNGFGGVLGQGSTSFLPTVLRNNEIGEPNYRFDLRVARDLALTERLRVELLGEAFNLFNRSNFNGFNTTAFFATATTATTPLNAPVVLTNNAAYFSRTNNSSQPDGTNARRFQLALRLRF
jgi:hypothetical protein